VPTHFGPLFLTEDYVTLQCDPTNWEGYVSHGVHSYVCFWESELPGRGLPGRGRLLVRVPANVAHHFTGTGGFSRLD
jgi:hypothetical protein